MAVSRDLIEDAEYWRRINPGHNLTDSPWPDQCKEISFSDIEIRSFRKSIVEEGYFQTQSCIPELVLERLIDCIKAVRDEGHKPVYALLYDDFFEVLASLGGLLRGILGPDFLIVPDETDVYIIKTSNKDAGSGPHRDTLRAHDSYDSSGIPGVINLWIPITNATNLNSCMHVIPAYADPNFGTPRSEADLPNTVDMEFLQSVRALPAKAGSVLGWTTELIHWGGCSSDMADLPRLSFAMYFQRANLARFHPTAMPVPFRLEFEYRLYLIEKEFRDPDGEELSHYL